MAGDRCQVSAVSPSVPLLVGSPPQSQNPIKNHSGGVDLNLALDDFAAQASIESALRSETLIFVSSEGPARRNTRKCKLRAPDSPNRRKTSTQKIAGAQTLKNVSPERRLRLPRPLKAPGPSQAAPGPPSPSVILPTQHPPGPPRPPKAPQATPGHPRPPQAPSPSVCQSVNP